MSSRVIERLTAVLRDGHTGPLVGEYFRRHPSGEPWFTGSWFERIGGGGDRGPDGNRVTAHDLVAVQTLGVTVPAQAAIWILGAGAEELAACLADIPVGITPADPEGKAQLAADDSPLERLWELLHDQPGVGWVIAGKLCARKRPALAPVYDQHVRDAAGRTRRWWTAVVELFANETVVQLLEQHHSTAKAAGGDVTLLRTLDIAVWMRQHGYQWASRELHPGGAGETVELTWR